jgi:hypothetical protein
VSYVCQSEGLFQTDRLELTAVVRLYHVVLYRDTRLLLAVSVLKNVGIFRSY